MDVIHQASEMIGAGNAAGAKELLTQAVKTNPNDPRLWELLGRVVDQPDQAAYCRKRAADLRAAQPAAPVIVAQPVPAPAVRPAPAIPQQPAKRKTPWYVWVGLVILTPILCCMCWGMLGAMGGDTINGQSSPLLSPQEYKVVYKVQGSGSADVTYYNADNGTEQQKTNLPWQKSFTMEFGKFVSLVAQTHETNSSITCIIEVNGEVYKQSTSKGDYVLATCSGWLGMEK